MNKQEALSKIKELERFIASVDSEITLDMIVPGAYFQWRDSLEYVTLIQDSYKDTWMISGTRENPFVLYNFPSRSKEDMLQYLQQTSNGKYTFLGVREFK